MLNKVVIEDIIIETLKLWDCEKSDLIVMKDKCPMEVKLPLTKGKRDLYRRFELHEISNDTAQYLVPVWIISYDNEWTDDGYVDHGVLLVAPYVDDE